MTWGVADTVVERFTAAGVPAASISCRPATFTFDTPGPPSAFLDDFRTYYGPTMNAFAAVGESGREAEPHRELDELFAAQNTSPNPAHTTIPATYLEVTVRV